MPKTKPPSAERPAIKAAPRAPFPPAMTPQLATLVAEPPPGAEWLRETKFDGFRVLCRIERGHATLFTRSGQDWTAHFEPVASAAAALPVHSAWLDGEVTVVLRDGRSSFGALQNRGEPKDGQQLVYFVFDLLHQDGHDLRVLPLQDRKHRLAALLPSPRPATGPLRYVDHVEGDAAPPSCAGDSRRWSGRPLPFLPP